MERRIISVGFDIPGKPELYHPYFSRQSLLDADVIIFEPQLVSKELYVRTSYQGKPSLNEDDSFKTEQAASHWKKELLTALGAGKTVFVFFGQYEEFYVDTGQRTYSGTGRNRHTTISVAPSTNFKFFPFGLPKIVPKGGNSLKFLDNPTLSVFWKELGEHLHFQSYLDEPLQNATFTTKTGGKVVGAIWKVGEGSLVLLPPIDLSGTKHTNVNSKTDEESWTKEGVKVGHRLFAVLLEIDKALRKAADKTPLPEWASSSDYTIAQEKRLRDEAAKITQEVAAMVARRADYLLLAEKEASLKDLLFEKGIPLENAIITALQHLQFKAEGFKEGTLQFDQVIVSPEGARYIGEAEGKDDAAVAIEKFRQLMSNIHEDFERDEVKERAVGILFGNGYRLTAPADRKEQFTEKCLTTAKTSNCILIRTCDLFRVAKYVKESGDAAFAKLCREAIAKSVARIVEFPPLPSPKPATA